MLEIKPILNALLRSKAGALMLMIQVAITVAIVSNAAFIINDRIKYLQQDTGYPEDQVFSFTIFTYGEDVNLVQKFEQNETMLRNLPGVINAAALSTVPLSGSGSASSFHLAADPKDGKSVRAAYTGGDENLLDSLGVSISEGRNFSPDEVIVSQDFSKLPEVVIVSKPFLVEMFPDGDGLGNTIFMGPEPLKIIGVVDKMMGPWLKDSAADRMVVFPFLQPESYQRFVVRTSAAERAAVMRQIEDFLLEDYNKRVITNVIGLDESKQDYNAGDVLMMRMLIVLIVVLVLVTVLGIFGLTVFNISKRTKQIGTRRALGARKSAIIRYFMVENGLICLAGLFIGSLAAIYLSNVLLKTYSLPALDNVYILFTALFVFVMSLLSVILPANKAANISPSVATRSI